MSPTVLLLSLLLLQPPAEAEEMMDPFALIRQTLKYWRRIYEMYQEEVTLGYCWAEYFLRQEENMKNVPMSRSTYPDGSNFGPTKHDESMKRADKETFLTNKDTFHRVALEVWHLPMDSPREQVHNKGSYELLNTKLKNVPMSRSRSPNRSNLPQRDKNAFHRDARGEWHLPMDSPREHVRNKDSYKLLNTTLKNVPMSHSTFPNRSNFGQRNKHAFHRDTQEEWHLPIDSLREHVRNKRSYEQLNIALKNTSMSRSAFPKRTKFGQREKETFHPDTQEKWLSSLYHPRKHVRSKRSYELLSTALKNIPMSRSTIQGRLNFESTKHESTKRADTETFITDTQGKWLLPLDSPREHVRNKGSYELLNSALKNIPMSRSTFQDELNFGSTKHESMKRADTETFLTDTQENWLLSLNNPQEHDRSKRSYEPLNTTDADIYEISMISENNTTTNDEERLPDQRSTTIKVHSKTQRNLKSIDHSKHGLWRFWRNMSHELLEFENIKNPSFFDSSLLNSSKGAILNPEMEAGANNKEKVSVQKSRTKLVYTKPGCDLESMTCRKHSFRRPRRKKKHQFSGVDDVNRPLSTLLSSLNGSQEILKISEKSATPNENKRLSVRKFGTSKVYPKTVKMEHDLRSSDCRKHASRRSAEVSGDNGVRSSSSLPFSWNIFAYDSGSPTLKGRKIVKILFDPKFKGNRAEVDRELSGESKDLEVDTRRKVLYLKTSHGASGCSPRRSFSLKLSRPEVQKPLDAHLLSLPGVAPFKDSQFNGSDTTKKFDGSKGRGDFRRGRELNSSNPEFQEAEQRPRTLKGSYQKNLRRKRDAGDRIRSLFVRSLSKTSPKSFDKSRRIFSSSVYTVPKRTIWKHEIESRMVRSRNNEERDEGRNWGLRKRVDSPIRSSANSSSFYTKQHTNTRQRKNHRPPTSKNTRRLPVSFKGIYNIPSPLVGNPWTLRLPRQIPIEDQGQKRENNWEKEGSSKQLLTVNDNRYRRTERSFLVKKSVPGETGKKEPIQYLMGQPSLLPGSYRRFMGDYGSPTSGTSRNSRPSRSSRAKDQGRRSLNSVVEARGRGRTLATLFNLPAAFMSFLRSLGFFVQVGRQIMDYVESNTALACTKNYLWGKAVQWIDS